MRSSNQPASNGMEREERALFANPILEAFGNACTLRNENSSRFGKFMRLMFQNDHRNRWRWKDSIIETYLLEKVRVVHQMAEERNFHIFYELMDGMSCDMRQELQLNGYGTSDFEYINQRQSSCRKDGVDDADEFHRVESSMEAIGMGKSDQLWIWKVLACILHLGNIDFQDFDENEMSPSCNAHTGCIVLSSKKRHLQAASSLLSIQVEELLMLLTARSLSAGGEVYHVFNTIKRCTDARNCMARALYGLVFEHLIAKVNVFQGSHTLHSNDSTFIGVLDIFGFEVFESNHFEQFCINYANEKLQYIFLSDVLVQEQQVHVEEGVAWSNVAIHDNSKCISLIEDRPNGIFSILDEECLIPKGNDASLARKMGSRHGRNAHFEVSRKDEADTAFIIKHYAGNVRYQADGFCEKNKDSADERLLDALSGSGNCHIAAVVSENAARKTSETSRSSGIRHRTSFIGSSGIGSKFRQQLKSLLETVNDTTRHFIRCIKPNCTNEKDLFDECKVSSQLRHGGILQAASVSRQSYPVRLLHDEFLRHYWMLRRRDFASSVVGMSIKLQVERYSKSMLQLFIEESSESISNRSDRLLEVGRTRIFMSQLLYDYLEKARDSISQKSAVCIQCYWRRYSIQKAYKSKYSVVLKLQRWCKLQTIRIRKRKTSYAIKNHPTEYADKTVLQRFQSTSSTDNETHSMTSTQGTFNHDQYRNSTFSTTFWSEPEDDSTSQLLHDYQTQLKEWQDRALAAEMELDRLGQSKIPFPSIPIFNQEACVSDTYKSLQTAIITNEIDKLNTLLTSSVIAQVLTQSNADSGCTLLHLAVQYGRKNVFGLFFGPNLLLHLDINATDFNGNTALHYACRLSDLSIASYMTELLLSFDADANLSNNLGQSALHIALMCRGRKASVRAFFLAQILLRYRPIVNQRDCRMRTALHYAAENGMKSELMCYVP
uniref:Myosinlike protein putative n=1 Tax=Albugo laibachii Nc14 TaxID=890382 RepID=F0W092_9STRA|nr:myosinlike protein putative [Albugo laibachii Nc14]|eukprot:CCA14463.1 myosinlike protein putative [Albugo laibachii Nc14]